MESEIDGLGPDTTVNVVDLDAALKLVDSA